MQGFQLRQGRANCGRRGYMPPWSPGAQILTGQTIGTSFVDNVDHYGLVIVDRALTGPETVGLTAYLNALAGV